MWDYDYLQEMSKGIQEIVTYGSGLRISLVLKNLPYRICVYG